MSITTRPPIARSREITSSGKTIRGGANPSKLTIGQRILFELPWSAAMFLLRIAYGFRVQGLENLPRKGPFILVTNEHSPIAFMITGWIAIVALMRSFRSNPETISFLREELFDFPFFRSALNDKAPGRYAPLAPTTAGRLALGLLEAYRILQGGGIVVLNPEGDMPWDGRPLPLGHALAWLGLHTAAPIVPAMISMGAYDIWPRWRPWMHRQGKVRLSIGEPLRLTETPRARVMEADMTEAEQVLRARFDELCYGPGGLREWSGVPTRDGVPLAAPVVIPSLPRRPDFDGGAKRPALWKRGMALLLWRCPVCHTDDAIVHHLPVFGRQTVRCQACHTVWGVRHIPEKDFRLCVLEGPSGLKGIEMALSAWYDEMRRELPVYPMIVTDVRLEAGEQVIAATRDVSLLPRRPNILLDRWDGREPPRIPAPGATRMFDWESVGQGRLLLTDARLLWQGPRGELDFRWENINSVSLWMLNTLTIRYGAVPYRFELGLENGLKWLTYASVQAQRAAQPDRAPSQNLAILKPEAICDVVSWL